MHKNDVLVLLFLLAFYSPAYVDSRKVQFDLKEVGTEHRANYQKNLTALDVLDDLINAYKNTRMQLRIKTYSQFNQDKKKQSDFKVDSFKFKLKRDLLQQNHTRIK